MKTYKELMETYSDLNESKYNVVISKTGSSETVIKINKVEVGEVKKENNSFVFYHSQTDMKLKAPSMKELKDKIIDDAHGIYAKAI